MNDAKVLDFLDRPGALGALVDLYERAVRELQTTLRPLSAQEFEFPHDPESPDPDCVSIRSVTQHVVSSGYTYALYLRDTFGRPAMRPDVQVRDVAGALAALDELVAFTEASVAPEWARPYDELASHSIRARWGQTYDVEQLLEHAVTHVERHRRQILKFLRRGAEPAGR